MSDGGQLEDGEWLGSRVLLRFSGGPDQKLNGMTAEDRYVVLERTQALRWVLSRCPRNFATAGAREWRRGRTAQGISRCAAQGMASIPPKTLWRKGTNAATQRWELGVLPDTLHWGQQDGRIGCFWRVSKRVGYQRPRSRRAAPCRWWHLHNLDCQHARWVGRALQLYGASCRYPCRLSRYRRPSTVPTAQSQGHRGGGRVFPGIKALLERGENDSPLVSRSITTLLMEEVPGPRGNG